jgi:hypothetical protein
MRSVAGSRRRRAFASLGIGPLLLGAASFSGATAAAVALNHVTASAATSCAASGEPEIFETLGKSGNPIAVTPAPNSVVIAGQTLTAEYSDETDLNINGNAAKGIPALPPTFTIDGQAVQFTVTKDNSPAKGSQTFNYKISIVVPSNLSDGNHTAKVTAWDQDQNKGKGCEGDFGQAQWTIVVGNASITVTPAEATNQVGQQHVFTVTLTAAPHGLTPVTFGALSTSVTPAPSTLGTTCGSPTVSNNTQTCTITINSDVAGTFTANAAGSVTMGGQKVNRSTNNSNGPPGPKGSGPGVKHYVLAPTPAPTPTPSAAVLGIAITAAPNTGAMDKSAIIGGLLLVMAGGGLVEVARRRRS